ncbi:MAG: peptidylprolyl isomerase [Verrucomicrobiota bacterium JB023]|nr:peptidylprolyl isomerase [Verrucomicrobiota bacterium JB023]
MRPDKGALVRAIVYGLAIVYLFLDLFVFYGPLKTVLKGANPMSESAIAKEIDRGVAARVYFQPILLTQIDRRVQENLWRQGSSPEGVTPERLKDLRLVALNSLFNEHLLRIKVRYNAEDAIVDDAALADGIDDLQRRFTTPAEFAQAIEGQGWQGQREIQARVGARIQQEVYLGERISVEVGDDEVRAFYDENRELFRVPARVRVRQIFFAALDHPDGEARRLAESALQEIHDGRDFALVAREKSEDAGSRDQGGELGWVTRERLLPEFTDAVFDKEVPSRSLIETRLGAHLVEVLDKEVARLLDFEEVREDLRVALSNRKREEGLKAYFANLRHYEQGKLEIFEEVLNRPWSL